MLNTSRDAIQQRKGPVPEDTGPTLVERGWNQGHPPVSAILPKKSLRTALEWEEVCSASNRHFHVSRYHRACREGLVAGAGPTVRQPPDDAAASVRGAACCKGCAMRNSGKRPRGGLHVWLMAVIVICLAPAMHSIAADIVVMAIAIWAMTPSRR